MKSMNDLSRSEDPSLPPSLVERIDEICDGFEAAWKAGQPPRIEDYLTNLPDAEMTVLLRQLLLLDVDYRGQQDEFPRPEDYLERFPGCADIVESVFDETLPVKKERSGARSATTVLSNRSADTNASGPEPPPTISWNDPSYRTSPQISDLPEIPDHEMLEVIARGGMGVVLKARQKELGRVVAVKLPLPARLSGEEDRERFVREARTVATLRHANICPIYEVGQVQQWPFITMAFIDGETLAERGERQRPSAREAAQLVAVLAWAVAYAHEHNVLHRDIKPANVMVDRETGQPVLMDFGLAKHLTVEGESDLTRSGQIMGTPAYMAPEQAAGQNERVDQRSDVYSLGAVLYQLLTGRAPFSGNSGEVLWKVQSEEPVAPRQLVKKLHLDVETICLKAMAKDPSERYESAAALAEDLERFCNRQPIMARRQSVFVRTWRKMARRPILSAIMASAFLAIVISVVLVLWGRQDREVAERDRQVTQLLAQLDAKLDAADWSEEHLAKMDTMIAELATLSEPQATFYRDRLAHRFAASLKADLDEPNLTTETRARIEARLVLLEQRDAQRAATVRRILQSRLSEWQLVFDLTPPFENLAEFLPANVAKIEKGKLLRELVVPEKASKPVCTQINCSGVVRFEAEFDALWETASQVGLVLGEIQSTGSKSSSRLRPSDSMSFVRRGAYRFLIRSQPVKRPAGAQPLPAPDDPPINSFLAVRQRKGQFIVEIRQQDDLLRAVEVSAAKIPPGPLHLTVTREGDHLTFSVANLPAVEFFDPFAYLRGAEGVFALHWPNGVGLIDLQAYRRTLPREPRPLEQGEALCAGGQFHEALQAFRRQSEVSTREEVLQESRFKQAMCLLALGRDNEAEHLLGQLIGQSEHRWAAMAAFHLWYRYIRQKKFDDADAVFAVVSARYELDDLAAIIPQNLRNTIAGTYAGNWTGRTNTELVAHAERTIQVVRFLGYQSDPGGWPKCLLVKAYHRAGQHEKVVAAAMDGFRDLHPSEVDWTLKLRILLCAMSLRRLGRTEEALSLVDQWLAAPPERQPPDGKVLLLAERVRLLAALGRWEDADTEIEQLISTAKLKEMYDFDGPLVYALCGFLRLRRGDEPGAQQAWQVGAREAWRPPDADPNLVYVYLRALTGQMSENDVVMLFKYARVASNNNPKYEILLLMQTPLLKQLFPLEEMAAIVQEMLQAPRGREIIRSVVFGEIARSEALQHHLASAIVYAIRRGAFPDGATQDEEALLWEFAQGQVVAAWDQGVLDKPQLIQLALTWQGTTNLLGWAGVAEGLPAELRGPAAYFFGHRYLTLGGREDAGRFFQTAADDAEHDSPLKSLAQAALDQLAESNK
jgi:tetratricopeptide (TPR) repeat protein/predicted Ser/Thr protein kinase